MVEPKDVELLVVAFFLDSSDFNGLPLSRPFDVYKTDAAVTTALRSLVLQGRVNCTFSSLSLNPHIKRVPDLSPEKQVEHLTSEPPAGVCLYPSADLVRENCKVEEYDNRPFTKQLLLGEAQLKWEAFDLGVFDRYRNDPRYHFEFFDYAGRLSIRDAPRDAGALERDKVFLQTFGVGYGEGKRRVAVVFLRYLADLSPEHQQYWASFLLSDPFELHPDYYRSAYLGEWPEYVSYFSAILVELRLINQLAEGIWSAKLFRDVYEAGRPAGFTPFFRPTLKSFNEFVLAMDKLLSENLNYEFFRGRVPLERERLREDGKVAVERKSTVALFEEWLRAEIDWADERGAMSAIVGPFRDVRKRRQAPAHKLQEDHYSQGYDDEQHTIFHAVYLSLMHLRLILERHPAAPPVDVPRYLREGKIAFV